MKSQLWLRVGFCCKSSAEWIPEKVSLQALCWENPRDQLTLSSLYWLSTHVVCSVLFLCGHAVPSGCPFSPSPSMGSTHFLRASRKALKNFLFPANFSFELCLRYLFARFYFIYFWRIVLKNIMHTHTHTHTNTSTLHVYLEGCFANQIYLCKKHPFQEQNITSTQKPPRALFEPLPTPEMQVPTIFISDSRYFYFLGSRYFSL